VATKAPCTKCGQIPTTGAVVFRKWLCYPCINAWNLEAPSDQAWDDLPALAKVEWTANWAERQ
jgi:hypothetical protein